MKGHRKHKNVRKGSKVLGFGSEVGKLLKHPKGGSLFKK